MNNATELPPADNPANDEDLTDSNHKMGASVDILVKTNPMDIVIIKFGKFVNRMARISSFGASNRVNLQIMYDNGELSRRSDGAIENTALLRSKFDFISSDLNEAIKLLPSKRRELDLCPYEPHPPPARRVQIGSPMNKSKTKPRASVDDSGGTDEDDDGESRNNLYWAEVKDASDVGSLPIVTASSRGYFCLWYGGDQTSAEDPVAVLPISPLVIHEREAPLLLSAGNLCQEFGGSLEQSQGQGQEQAAQPTPMDSDLYFGPSAEPPLASPLPSLPSLFASSPSAPPAKPPADTIIDAAGAEELAQLLGVSTTRMVHVKRAALQPLDVDLVRAKYSAKHESDVVRHYMIALVQFAEWDYPQRESYVWPEFALRLMTDPVARDDFLDTAVRHPLNTGARPLSEVILFLLCAEHIGVLEEWDDAAFVGQGQAADSIVYLLESLDEFRTTDEAIYRPFCRVADCFQVDPTHYAVATPAPTATAAAAIMANVIDLRSDAGSNAEQEESALSFGSRPAFVPPPEGDQARIDAYLGEVDLLRQQHVRPHQVVEAPLDLDVFVRNWETFLRDRGHSVVFGPSPEEQYRRCRQLNRFIAHARRRSRRYTSLCTVKYVVAPSAAGVGSGASGQMAPSSTAGTPPASTSTTKAPSPVKEEGSSFPAIEAAVLDKATMLLASSAEALGISAPTPAPRERSLIVHYGQQEVKVPIKYCRLLCMPEDAALEILHECGGDTAAALRRVAEVLCSEPDGPTAVVDSANNAVSTAIAAPKQVVKNSKATEDETNVMQRAAVNRIIATQSELDCFHHLVTKLVNDIERIHNELARRLARQRARASEIAAGSSNGSSSASAVAAQPATTGPYFPSSSLASPADPQGTGTTNVHPSFSGAPEVALKPLPVLKDTMRMFLVFYPHWDEDDTFPNMSSFNSALFTQCCGNNGIASAAAARTLERAALKAANGGGETGAVNRARGRPPKGPNGAAGGGGGGGGGAVSRASRSAGTSASATPRQTVGRPNRWPANLPTIQHNLFWITHNAQPCLCTGLHFKGKNTTGDAQLSVINIHPEARRMIVAPNMVEPFHDDLMRHAVDDKTATFACAMADFCEWELEHHVPVTSLLRRWYVYPDFITNLLLHNSRWTGWRKSVERLPRAGSGISRRENYFQALVEEYGNLTEHEKNERYNLGSYPWDDTPLSEEDSSDDEDEEDGEERSQHSGTLSGFESYGDRGDCSDEEARFNDVSKHPARVVPSRAATGTGASATEGGAARDAELQKALFSDAAFTDNVGALSGKKRGRPPLSQADGTGSSQSAKVAKAAKALSASSDDGASSNNKPTHMRSLYNLFWIPRSQLPCLYYDRKENRFTDKFLVIPICCVTYHYPFQVTSGMRGPGGIEPLKMQHLKLITDERTSEFTHALLEFAQHETHRQRKARLQAELMGSQQDGSIPGVQYDGTGTEEDGDDNSLMDAAIVQPNEVFDWPDFILELVNKPAMWHSWRKKAERAGPGLKRHQYLRALQNDWKEIQAAQALALQEQKLSSQQPAAPSLQIHSYYNLFWLLRSNLPAIYYDREECRYHDKFTVLPINCFQYQYPIKIANSSVAIEPLSMVNLAKCTDERTHDFTLALIDFAKWEIDNRRALASQTNDSYFSEPKDGSRSGTAAGGGGETTLSTDVSAATSIDESTELYNWPDFILHLINSPDEWSTWRKRAERSSGRECRRTVYLRALMEDYKSHQAASAQTTSGQT